MVAVTCVIMQKNGAGMITATSCYWDKSTDGKILWFHDFNIYKFMLFGALNNLVVIIGLLIINNQMWAWDR
jgi:hypothetical protein